MTKRFSSPALVPNVKIWTHRLERWAWYAFLVTLPWQTRLIVWQADRTFIEWRSASLWITDCVLVVLLILGVINARWRDWKPDRAEVAAGFVVAAALLSLGAADALAVGIITIIKFIECWLLIVYVRHRAMRVMDPDRSVVAFIAAMMLQAMLAIAQYAAQHDMGLRWLGETVLDPQMRGVAVFLDAVHQRVLRAYGTLPHPNVLAAYLSMSLWALTWLWVRTDRRGFMRVCAVLLTALLTAGLFVTFARTIIAVSIAAAAVTCVLLWTGRISRGWQSIDRVRRVVAMAGITVVVTMLVMTALNWPQVVGRMTVAPTEEAVRMRVTYNQRALESGGWSFFVNWTGVGIGNFTTWLDRWDPTMPVYMYQPAHNVLLLAYTEIGVVGVMMLLLWLAVLLRASWAAHTHQPVIRLGLWAMAASLAFVAMMDHFPWTLQQGRLLTALFLALLAGPVGATGMGRSDTLGSRHD